MSAVITEPKPTAEPKQKVKEFALDTVGVMLVGLIFGWFMHSTPAEDPTFDESTGKWGYTNKIWIWKIAPQFEEVNDFSRNGLALVKVDGKYGFINKNGDKIISSRFEDAKAFTATKESLLQVNGSDWAAFAKEAGKWGVINDKGAWVIDPTFDEIPKGGKSWSKDAEWRDSDLLFAIRDGKIGWIDVTGKWIVEPQFDASEILFNYGYAQVAVAGKWGVINDKGEIVVPLEFDALKAFKNGTSQGYTVDKRCDIEIIGEKVVQACYPAETVVRKPSGGKG